jgi:GNAT superfamily N-acetyltransferase
MATGDTRIRLATLPDVDAVGGMGAQLLRVHHQFDRDRFMQPGGSAEQGYARFLGAQLDAPDTVVFVAERDGRIIGYVYAGIEPRSWKELRERAGFVHDLFVNDENRGSGAAELLMTAACEWFRERDVPRVLLWTSPANERARRLFERLGFRSTMIEMTREL